MRDDHNDRIPSQALKAKVPALRGKDAATNLDIFEVVALSGPQTKYGINKLLKRSRVQYPTILRAVTKLEKRGYLTKTDPVKMRKRRGVTPTFGITWRGLLAALASDRVSEHVIEVVGKNTHLLLPFPRAEVFDLVRAAFNESQLGPAVRGFATAFFNTLAYDIETSDDAVLFANMFPALVEAESSLNRLHPKAPVELRKYPRVIDWLIQLADQQIAKFEDTIEKMQLGRRYLVQLKLGEGHK
jgi:hypothetical protein